MELIVENKFGRMVSWDRRGVIDVSIEDAVAAYQQVDINGSLVHTARMLGICMGDE